MLLRRSGACQGSDESRWGGACLLEVTVRRPRSSSSREVPKAEGSATCSAWMHGVTERVKTLDHRLPINERSALVRSLAQTLSHSPHLVKNTAGRPERESFSKVKLLAQGSTPSLA